jgi:hypothetical protein
VAPHTGQVVEVMNRSVNREEETGNRQQGRCSLLSVSCLLFSVCYPFTVHY